MKKGWWNHTSCTWVRAENTGLASEDLHFVTAQTILTLIWKYITDVIVLNNFGLTDMNNSFTFQQNQPREQDPLPSSTRAAAEPDAHLQSSCPVATPSPANGFRSSLTSRRSAGPVGSSPPAVTTLTTAPARVHSRWGGTSKPPTMPQCAPSCTHSNSPVTWGRPAASPTNSSPSAYCTLMTRRTSF